MIRPSQAFRLIHINLVLLRHGLDEVILATHLFRPIRFLSIPFSLVLVSQGSLGLPGAYSALP